MDAYDSGSMDVRFFMEFVKRARLRQRSDAHYYKFQQLQAFGVYRDISRILKVPKNVFMIDFGCGRGGYTSFFTKKYKRVLGVDFYKDPIFDKGVAFKQHDLTKFVSKKKADFIFCASVIEHIKDQDRLVSNIYKSLKPKGALYLSFPPFYSFFGGHMLKPFHFLGEKPAIWIGKRLGLLDRKVTSYENLYHTWGLYRTHIGSITKLLRRHGFRIVCVKPRYFSPYLPFNVARYPLVRDLLTWHVEFYCRRG